MVAALLLASLLVSPSSVSAEPPDRTNVLVYLDRALPHPSPQRAAVRNLATKHGGFVRYEYKNVMPNVLNLRNIPVQAVEALSNLSGVVNVAEDRYYPNVLKLDESTPHIRGLDSQITGAGLSADGTGVRLCVCDTGIDMDHLMYATRIDTAASFDFANNDPNPEDDHGHGAHVAGIAVGRTGLSVNFGVCDGSEPFQGVAPNATLIGVKILNQNGGGSDSDIIAGIDHCADQTASGARADVINLSIGTGQFNGPCDSHPWAVAANNAVANGVVVVAAAGNEGFTGSLSTPACASDVIAAGATYKADYPRCEDTQSSFAWCLDPFCFSTCTDSSPPADEQVCFSNQSNNLDVTAPGAVIWSASTAAGGDVITEMSGTSMASPHVAGLAALVLDSDPTLSPSAVRQIIRDGAIDLGPAGFDTGYGFGRIDVINSLSLVQPCQSDADCDDGWFCNGAETCDLGSGACQPGTDPCPGQSCDETGDVCLTPACDDDGICEAGEDCNSCPNDCFSGGSGVCGNGLCEGNGEDCFSCSQDCRCAGGRNCNGCCGDGVCGPAGENGSNCPADCDGSFEPPAASCCGDTVCEGTEDTSNCGIDCAACATSTDCDDLDPCTVDVCSSGACSNTPVDCDDGDACTSDSCSAGTCSHDPLSCDDLDLCTIDNCDPASGCIHDPIDCVDGDICTTDTCAPATGCVNDPIVPCCGDTFCEVGEDACSCPADCGSPPGSETNCSDGVDEDCDGQTDCSDSECTGDPACPTGPVCGNRVCEGNGEDCHTCPGDCRCSGRNCSKGCCGDGACVQENASNCPVDCGG
jgi:subtilisin family serine protease